MFCRSQFTENIGAVFMENPQKTENLFQENEMETSFISTVKESSGENVKNKKCGGRFGG